MNTEIHAHLSRLVEVSKLFRHGESLELVDEFSGGVLLARGIVVLDVHEGGHRWQW